MESYIEVSMINNFLIMFLSCVSAGYISLKPISIKHCICYCLCISIGMGILWGSYSWTVYILLEVLFFTAYFRYRISMYLVMMVLRSLLSFTCYAFMKGSYHLFMYYVPIYKNPIGCWIIMTVVILALLSKWNYFIAKLAFVYECKFIHNNLSLKGYLDSGNMLTKEDVPVIFINEKYKEYFENENIQSIVMNTLDSTSVIMCFETMIQLEGYEQRKVLVNFDKKTKLPLGCEILLNAKLLMR